VIYFTYSTFYNKKISYPW